MKASRMSVWFAPLGVVLMSLSVAALSVGEMEIGSYLGEPLEVSIGLNSIERSEESSLSVSLASKALFKSANISYPDFADKLEISIDPIQNGQTLIHVKSLEAINDPFVYLLLKISWAGGDILREFTALIDPSDYSVQALAKATSSATKIGTPIEAKKANSVKSIASNLGVASELASENVAIEGYDAIVKNGDSLSSITALFRPEDITIQQAWIAFYKLNPSAFIGENLNVLVKGSPINFPSYEQMTAMPHGAALLEVMRMIEPSSLPEGYVRPTPTLGVDSSTAASPQKMDEAPITTPTLIIGRMPDKGQSESQPMEDTVESAKESQDQGETAQDITESLTQDSAQFQSDNQLDQTTTLAVAADEAQKELQPMLTSSDIETNTADMSVLEQRLQQQLSANQNETALIKDELITTRSENRTLLERMARLESQLGKMSELLALQTKALERFSTNVVNGNQTEALSIAQDELNSENLQEPGSTSKVNSQALLSDVEADAETSKKTEASEPPANNTWKLIVGLLAVIGGLFLWLRSRQNSDSVQNTSEIKRTGNEPLSQEDETDSPSTPESSNQTENAKLSEISELSEEPDTAALVETNDGSAVNISSKASSDFKVADLPDEPAEEVDGYDAETSLELGKAYVELGEEEIARDFLRDAAKTGDEKISAEANDLLKELSK